MISIAIPTWNRFEFVVEAIKEVEHASCIREIILSDDASTDGSVLKLRKHYLSADSPHRNEKVFIYENKKNLDCYANKAQAVRHVTGDWTILFDSDNVMPLAYLETLLKLRVWNPRSAYLPVFASPHFDYRSFEGLVINRQNVAGYLGRKNFTTALNTANYFFHRDEYLRIYDGTVNPHTADSIYMNYRWLAAGNSLVFVPGLSYFHRVHPQSHYKLNCKKTGNFAKEVEMRLAALR